MEYLFDKTLTHYFPLQELCILLYLQKKKKVFLVDDNTLFQNCFSGQNTR